jgi:hypothetical protein
MNKKIPDDYEIGYGKPPAHTKFQKGTSGNPNGRPRGSANVNTLVRRAARERITVTENGRSKTITKLEAVAKQLVNRAVAFDPRAVTLLLPMLAEIDQAEGEGIVPKLDADDEAVARSALRRIAAMSQSIESAPAPTTKSRARSRKRAQHKE